MTVNSKNGRKRLFSWKPKLQYHLSQWGECIYVPNQEMKGDCYLNPYLSQLANEL